jgi:hypothetical protein
VAIRSFRPISGNPVALTNAGMDHIAKRHPELKNFDLANKIGVAIESPDYVVQGKFGRHIAVRSEPMMLGKAKYMVVIYENGGEVITAFMTSKIGKIIRRNALWKRC